MNQTKHTTDEMHLVILTGMSGSGKSVVLRALEDLEFYCVDNLPPSLMPALLDELDASSHKPHRIAVGIDIRNPQESLDKIPYMLSDMSKRGVTCHLVFVDSRDEVLIKRYSETRRRHPLSSRGLSLADAIATERRLMRPLARIAERSIDTSDTNVHQLRRQIAARYAEESNGLSLLFESFGFKHGLPVDSDFTFDVRCLPNPHWDPVLRPLTGRDQGVSDFLRKQPVVAQYMDDISRFLETWLPRFDTDDRSYVTVSIGCTGGRHRSVYIVEQLTNHFRGRFDDVLCYHRELD